MLECLILGDSLAVGVANAATRYHRPCIIQAHGGDNSSQIFVKFRQRELPNQHFKNTIISLGTNDQNAKQTLEYANRIRERIRGQVWWVLPSATLRPEQRKAVQDVARIWRDQIIDLEPRQLSPDGIHATPRGYIEIADRALEIIDKD